jgi:hypothetical protein
MKKIVLLAAAIAAVALYATPAFATATSPITYSGQGIPLNSQCDANNTPYLQFNFTFGGNFNPTNVSLSGISVVSQSQQGNNVHFITAYADPASLIGVVKVSWTGEVGNSANLVISHGCAGTTSTTGGTDTTTGGTDTTTGGTDTTTGGTDTTTGGTDTTTGGTDTTTGGTDTTTGGTTGTTGTGGVSGSTTGGTTGGTAATPSSGELPFTGLPVWMPLLAAAAMLGTGIVLVRRRKAEGS